jgi:hypothetical protein
MSRVQIRFRLVLPIVFGFLALVLMAWDYENNRMIGLMGMGWETGPPFWPYRAIYVLLFSINAPAFVLSMPILKLLRLQTLSLQYGVWYPAIVGWWWWIGTHIDFGILGRQHFRQAKPLAGVFALASLSFLYGATRITAGEFHWWMEYGQDPSAASYGHYSQNCRSSLVVPPLRVWVCASGGAAVAAEERTSATGSPRILEASESVQHSTCSTCWPYTGPIRH